MFANRTSLNDSLTDWSDKYYTNGLKGLAFNHQQILEAVLYEYELFVLYDSPQSKKKSIWEL